MNLSKSRLFLKLIIILFCQNAIAIKTTGRIILGTAAVTERYASNAFGSTSNDLLVVSSRVFYKISEVGEDKWEYIFDLRDKHDFFGKLNKEQLQLESKNEFQIRQMNARWLNPQGSWAAQFGRFQVFESGSIYLDGFATEYRFNPEWKTGLLAGLNPKSVEISYLEYNSKASQNGVYFTYQKNDHAWNENQYFTLAYVNQYFNSQVERSFLYNNFVYQWDTESRLINSVYYDVAPSANLQTLNFIYQQKITEYITSEISALHLDVSAYKRNQSVLEKLTSSPYDESRLQLEYKFNQDNLAIQVISGKRKFDGNKKEEVILGYDWNNLFTNSFDLKTQLGYINNFTSKDNYIKLALGYYSKNWEINFDNQLGQNKNDDDTITSPIVSEIGITSYFSKQLYFNASFQRAADQNVTIISTFLRFGYRFGNQEIPPVRNGAPPRGAL
ncbi:MAG: hypothetical protein ABL930_08070 [Pseudobdellovibrio sp.]